MYSTFFVGARQNTAIVHANQKCWNGRVDFYLMSIGRPDARKYSCNRGAGDGQEKAWGTHFGIHSVFMVPAHNSRFHFGNSPRVLAWWILLTIDRRPSRTALSLRSSVSRSWVTCPPSALAAISGLPRGRWWQSSRLGLTPAGQGQPSAGERLGHERVHCFAPSRLCGGLFWHSIYIYCGTSQLRNQNYCAREKQPPFSCRQAPTCRGPRASRQRTDWCATRWRRHGCGGWLRSPWSDGSRVGSVGAIGRCQGRG